MAPFIDMAIGDAVDPIVVPEAEYDLICSKQEVVKSKKGKPQLKLNIDVEGHPNTKPIYYYLGLDLSELDEKQKNLRLLETKALCKAFNVPYEANGFNTDDFQGARGRGLLTVETDDQYGEQNRLKLRF